MEARSLISGRWTETSQVVSSSVWCLGEESVQPFGSLQNFESGGRDGFVSLVVEQLWPSCFIPPVNVSTSSTA